MSNLIHKIKDAVTHDEPSHSSNTAPNDRNFANKADHRVDNARGQSLEIKFLTPN